MVIRCHFVHASQRFAALRRFHLEGASREGIEGQVPNPVLHVNGLRKLAQEVPRSESGAKSNLGGKNLSLGLCRYYIFIPIGELDAGRFWLKVVRSELPIGNYIRGTELIDVWNGIFRFRELFLQS